jgi:hypothetical protein
VPEFEDSAGKLSLHGADLGGNAHIHLGTVKNAFGRMKGRGGPALPFGCERMLPIFGVTAVCLKEDESCARFAFA